MPMPDAASRRFSGALSADCHLLTVVQQLEMPIVFWPETRNGSRVEPSAMSRSNNKNKIIELYDVITPTILLWGEHLHQRLLIVGDESKEKAQLQLVEHLAQLADIKHGSEILDIGCGMGGSSLFLARNY